ncbi:type II toxin-antitoxin system SpoIISA family toxin [Indiicoccus explosivorum]|uniref:type II toxin-antitoxin system SpoIISA family toxin n=1 Tax=Indiicoccus explosivorum TaxID=1917864 RepID=UPI0011868DCE|nr:type II toxin-antitoxin system SpoIISA family toxin [Indiicoccus explosivorum]
MLFIAGAWLCFVLVGIFVVAAGRGKVKPERVSLIRKIWYGILLLGFLLYITAHPSSLFEQWENYLIVLLIFAVADSFSFLGLYLKSAAGYELNQVTDVISELSESKAADVRSLKHVRQVMASDAVVGYFADEAAYLEGLKRMLGLYAELEGISIGFYSADDPEYATHFDGKDRPVIEASVKAKKTFYRDDSQLALFPIEFEGDPYVLELASPGTGITEVHVLGVDILIQAFLLATVYEEGGDPDGAGI